MTPVPIQPMRVWPGSAFLIGMVVLACKPEKLPNSPEASEVWKIGTSGAYRSDGQGVRQTGQRQTLPADEPHIMSADGPWQRRRCPICLGPRDRNDPAATGTRSVLFRKGTHPCGKQLWAP